MNASDRAALEIGRMFMRAHLAEQMLERTQEASATAELGCQQLEEINRELVAERDDLKAKLAEFTNGVEKPKPRRKVAV